MYGPRPGDRVCKVNFSRLSDQEKKNTNYLLAKQDHDIMFEEDSGYYVANVKFIKSPQKVSGNYGSPRGTLSKSPQSNKKLTQSKSPEIRKLSSKPAAKPVPSYSKKQLNYEKPNLSNPDRSKSRTKGAERGQSPSFTKFHPADKLDIIKVYQPLFPKNDLNDANFRPIMIGKSNSR